MKLMLKSRMQVCRRCRNLTTKTMPKEASQLITPHALSAEPRISIGYISERYSQVMAPRPALKVTTKRLNATTVTSPVTTGPERLATLGRTQMLNKPIATAWPTDPHKSNERLPQLSTTREVMKDTKTLAVAIAHEATIVFEAGMPPSKKNMLE